MVKYKIDSKKIKIQIKHLINIALEPNQNQTLADRYIEHARNLSMKSRVKIPSKLKFFICKKCKKTLIPGKTARFRTNSKREKHITITCLRCNHIYRKILKKTSNNL